MNKENKDHTQERAVFTVEEIKAMLRIGDKKAYELVKSKEFPVRKLGKRLLIPKEPFLRWLNQEGVEGDCV